MTAPTVPETYDEYLARVRAEERIHRDRFLGHDTHPEAPVYDERTGQVRLDDTPKLLVIRANALTHVLGQAGELASVLCIHLDNILDTVLVPIDNRVLAEVGPLGVNP